ncbi:hypothetical protein LJR015_002990 [Peribacillus frigoritolerans]|uniref:FtsX-like permease family protein n=1 Tax=Peribacillus frigoritolerans TaxID=450367 RepID=UPI003ECC9CCB
MIELAVRMLLARFKWFLLIVVSLGITLACIISLMTSSEAIKTSLQEKAYKNYGEHSGALIGINETKLALQSEGVDAGEYQLIDKLQINETLTATIGWMDNDAFKIGHINLNGKLPINENEVAIESFYLDKLDPTWKLGDKRELLIKNKAIPVKLVGIVENYSEKWTVPPDVEKGLNDLPNIFVASKDENLTKNTNNFLIRFHKENKKEMSNLLETYNDKGIINEKLFFNGLKQYDAIPKLTVTFQMVILIAASFCFWGLFYYFNLFQLQKDAQLKVLGCRNLKLYKLHIIQCVIIFLFSILLSIPLNIVFHKLIIKNTFFEGDLNLSDITNKVFVWVVVLFILVVVMSTKSINKFNKKSINNLLKNNISYKNSENLLINKFSSFTIKQLAIQLIQFPKQSLLIIFTLCLCIQTILFSYFLQKESEGIWDAKQDYYIDSQEIFGYEDIQNLNVLVNEGMTFPIEEVNKLEQTKGIEHVDKSPFMIDVHPLINPKLVTPSIESWVKQNGSLNSLYNQDIIIPNVRYQLVDSEEFSEIVESKEYEYFKGKILLILPQRNNNNDSKLIGEKLGFIKMFRDSGQLKTRKWEFEVFDVIERADSNINNKFLDDTDSELTIVLDKEMALESEIFTGYKDLTIYMKDNVSKAEEELIDSLVYEMVAPIPGSLYQKISFTKIEDTKITSYLGFLGEFSFLISLFLSTISIVSILLSKYYIKKRTWGIYMSLGMKKQSVIKLLSFEMFIYFFISIIFSTLIFFLSMEVLNHIYPTSFYVIYYMFAVLFIFIIAIIGVFALSQIIRKQPILSLLRINE